MSVRRILTGFQVMFLLLYASAVTLLRIPGHVQQRPSAPHAAGQPAGVAREAAITRARVFVARQPDAGVILVDSVETVQAPDDSTWLVLFKRADWRTRRPAMAAVAIHRRTGRASRVPLR